MDNRFCTAVKVLCLVWATHTASAEEPTIVPGDNDIYLPGGAVTQLQESDALRRHAVDLKRIALFGIGFVGGSILMSRVL